MRSELGLKCIQTSSCLILKSFTLEILIHQYMSMFCLKGQHDFNDYDSEYEEQHPELGFTDEQVEAEVAKLDP